MSPIKLIRPSIQVDSPVTLSSADAALAREIVQFAIEQLNDTIIVASRNRQRIVSTLERYRDDAQSLLERLRAG